MNKEVFQKYTIPDTPGVYFFLNAQKKILYIGKATSLKYRIKSYFDATLKEKRSALIEKMVSDASYIEWTETDSVLEALLLETNLIRTHKPIHNTRSKDDKSYNHLVITKEDFPRVLIVRGKDLHDADATHYAHIYGPFPSGVLFRDALKIIRSLFQYYDENANLDTHTSKMYKGKLDFNRQIGLYPEACTKEEYARTIRHIRLLFEGKKKVIIKDLEKAMFAHAKKEEFEEAHILKRKIFALQHIQDVALIKDEIRTYKDEKSYKIEAYDIAHLGGDDMVGAMVVIKNGHVEKSEYRKFIINGFTKANDTGALKEVLQRRLQHHEWKLPDLIVIDGGTAQKRVAESVLTKHGIAIPIVGVVKDINHRPDHILGTSNLVHLYKADILLANAEAHRFAITFHRKRRKII